MTIPYHTGIGTCVRFRWPCSIFSEKSKWPPCFKAFIRYANYHFSDALIRDTHIHTNWCVFFIVWRNVSSEREQEWMSITCNVARWFDCIKMTTTQTYIKPHMEFSRHFTQNHCVVLLSLSWWQARFIHSNLCDTFQLCWNWRRTKASDLWANVEERRFKSNSSVTVDHYTLSHTHTHRRIRTPPHKPSHHYYFDWIEFHVKTKAVETEFDLLLASLIY